MRILLAFALAVGVYAQAPLPTFSGSGGGGGGATTPGGSNTQLQYNNSNAFGGITGATSNGTTVTLTSPKITTILDGNGNPFITSSAQASAVDSITITNSVAGSPGRVTIGATGSDTDIQILLTGKNSNKVFIGDNNTFYDPLTGFFQVGGLQSTNPSAGFLIGGNNFSGTNAYVIGFTSGAWNATSIDTAISRDSAGVLDVGTGAQGSSAGTLKAATIVIGNSSFTFNGHTCTIVSTVVTCP